LFSVSCSAGTSSSFNSGKFEFETISSAEEARLEIQSAPTAFSLDPEQNESAWERAYFYLNQYAGEGKVVHESASDRDILTKSTAHGFRYQISRQYQGGGVNFQVLCTPIQGRGNPTDALLNAKNLARFIRTGELEMSIVK
jgi:hypothetical protein